MLREIYARLKPWEMHTFFDMRPTPKRVNSKKAWKKRNKKRRK